VVASEDFQSLFRSHLQPFPPSILSSSSSLFSDLHHPLLTPSLGRSSLFKSLPLFWIFINRFIQPYHPCKFIHLGRLIFSRFIGYTIWGLEIELRGARCSLWLISQFGMLSFFLWTNEDGIAVFWFWALRKFPWN